MSRQVCSPRILGSLFPAVIVMLLSSTRVLAHNPQNSDLADNPAVAAQLQSGKGKPAQLDGQIEIVHQDFRDGHGKFLFTLKQSDGTRVPMQFAQQPPTHLLTGDHVRANGQMLNGNLLLYSGGNVKQTGGGGSGGGGTTSSIPVPNTFGTQSVLVILVNFQDDVVQPYTVGDAQNIFFGTANAFFQENSYGQTSLTGDVAGWYTIPVSVTTCDMSQIATYAQSAATAAGMNLSSYTRYVYAFPQDNACGFGGASDVGGNPSQSWINGTPANGGTALDIHVINHELGHAFGLWHSHLLDCGTTSVICSSGTVQEYGDQMDVMGTVQDAYPDYNAFQKERLGWLNYGTSPSIQAITTSGVYTINPYELAGPGPNALKILQSTNATTGAKTWYYLESRRAIGFDAFLTTWPYSYTQNETNGVLFHLGTDGDGNSSLMLNMAPSLPTYEFELSLPTGPSFSDSAAGVTFTPTAVNSTSTTVQITMNGASACTPANPIVSVSPSQGQSVFSGTAVNFTVTVTDNDSSSCSPATFNLGSTVPPGWAALWNASGVTLSPGKSGSATLTVTAPAGTAGGSYNVGVTAINASAASYNGSVVATYVISTPGALSVSLWTDQSTYLPGQTVAIRVSLLSGTSPDAGASVSVTVMSPSGKKTSLTGTTGSNGVATLNYKLSRRAIPGTYQAQYGTAVAGAASVASTSTSFTVQ